VHEDEHTAMRVESENSLEEVLDAVWLSENERNELKQCVTLLI